MTRSNDFWQVISSSNAFLDNHFFPSLSPPLRRVSASSSTILLPRWRGVSKDNVPHLFLQGYCYVSPGRRVEGSGGGGADSRESLIAGGGGGRGVNNVSYSVTCDQFLEYLIVHNECLWHYLISLQWAQLSITGNNLEVHRTPRCRKRSNVGVIALREGRFCSAPLAIFRVLFEGEDASMTVVW